MLNLRILALSIFSFFFFLVLSQDLYFLEPIPTIGTYSTSLLLNLNLTFADFLMKRLCIQYLSLF